MKLTIHGPNLIDQSKGDFHVHAAGCRDNHREVRMKGFHLFAAARSEGQVRGYHGLFLAYPEISVLTVIETGGMPVLHIIFVPQGP